MENTPPKPKLRGTMAPGSALHIVLSSLVADIEAMQTEVPDEYEVVGGEEDAAHWFGPFETGTYGDERGYYIQWPNLGLLLKEAKAALEATKPKGSASPVESKALSLVNKLLE